MDIKHIPVELIPAKDLKANAWTSAEKGANKAKRLRLVDHDPQQSQSPKPRWIRAKLPKAKDLPRITEIKRILRDNQLHSVCEEASCPNLGECFGHGTATFMIMGSICTRKCPFCDVAHGRPLALDDHEPQHLASTIAQLQLAYVVITSVDRDDLKDGGANHYRQCVQAIRTQSHTQIELLVPDFRGCEAQAIRILSQNPPDVLNHNLETVPRLYAKTRPGASYQGSLNLLKQFKQHNPTVPTKSGLMVGLGETQSEMHQVLQDLRDHDVTMLTVGQYLQPSNHHLPVEHFWTPEAFTELENFAKSIGFQQVAAGPMVRSSYHADQQVKGEFANERTNQ